MKRERAGEVGALLSFVETTMNEHNRGSGRTTRR